MAKDMTESEKQRLVAGFFSGVRSLESLASDPKIKVKEEFVDGYEILGVRNVGGTAEILDAYHYETDTEVVIKRPRSDYPLHFLPMVNSELAREAKLIDRIDHPNIVSNIVNGNHHKAFVHNKNVHIPIEIIDFSVLNSLATPSLDNEFYKKMYSFMRLAVEAVGYLHDEIGVVHGDITPSQFLHARDGQVKLCDLASAKPIDRKYGTVTITEEYAPPAELRRYAKKEIDIYSLGKTFMRALTQFTKLEKEQRKELFREHEDDTVLKMIEKAYVSTFLLEEIIEPSIGSIYGNGFTMKELKHKVYEFGCRYGLRTESEIKAPKLDQNFLDALGFKQGGPGYDRPLVHTSHF